MISHKKRDFHWFNWATLVVLRKRYPLVKKPYLFVNNDDSFSVTFKSSEIFGMWYCIKNPLLVFFFIEQVYHHLWINAGFTIFTIANRFSPFLPDSSFSSVSLLQQEHLTEAQLDFSQPFYDLSAYLLFSPFSSGFRRFCQIRHCTRDISPKFY